MIGFSPGSDLRRLSRTLATCFIVGIVVGLAACVFHAALQGMTTLIMDRLIHYSTPRPYGEAVVAVGSEGPFRRWLLLVFPALGGLLCGVLVHGFAPEAAGAGGDAMIDAFHNKGGVIRTRVPLVKALASILVIGTGGSAGREGPIMQIGAGFGSYVGKVLGVSERQRRLLLIAGTAAGMAALFRTPLGAAIFAIEVLYRDDFEAEGIVPAIIASVTAYSVFITVYGQGHLFLTSPSYPFSPLSLPLYILMALILVGAGRLFVWILHTSRQRIWEPLRVPLWAKPALGGLAMGAIACVLPYVAGIGYGWLQDAILWRGSFPVAWGTVLLLAAIAVAKMVATSCTISSGGSGGDFGPSLVIGGLLGASCGQAFHLLMPGVVTQPGAFALVGMATFFGGIAHVPLASLIMVCELCGTYDLLVPLMLAEGVAFVLLRRTSLYVKQVDNPLASPAHTRELAIDILASVPVADALNRTTQVVPVPASMPLRALLEQASDSKHAVFPVADPAGRLIGLVSFATLRTLLTEELAGARLLVSDAMERLVFVVPTDTLSTALDRLLESGLAELPVASETEPKTIVGLIGHSEIVSAYNRELAQRRRLRDNTRDRMPRVSG